MTKSRKLLFSLITLGVLSYPALADTNILQDGTFLQPIGTGSNLTPWSDWTGAGISVVAGGPGGLGNYASIPVGGDLFQRFSPLSNGPYQLSFDVRNEASWVSTLVFSVQQILGTPIDIAFERGFASNLILQPASGWLHVLFPFVVNEPGFPVNEFYFSNSYDAPIGPIANSINRPGTVIDVANVVLTPVSNAPAPIPGSGLMSVLSLALVSIRRNLKQALSRVRTLASMLGAGAQRQQA